MFNDFFQCFEYGMHIGEFLPFPATFDTGGGFKTLFSNHRHVMSFADIKPLSSLKTA